MSLLNVFAGGVFLGVALLHVAPEAQEMYRLDAEAHGEDYSTPKVFICLWLGYVLVLFVDRVIAAHFAGDVHDQLHEHSDTARDTIAAVKAE